VVNTDRVRAALRACWHGEVGDLTPLEAGAGCRTWQVSLGDTAYLARLTLAGDRSRVEAGLAAVEHLCERGLALGTPVRAVDGALTAVVDEGILALHRHVPGRPLEAVDPLDQQWWGDLLGTVHRELNGFDHPGLTRWHWVRPEAAHLDLEPWLRRAVADAVAALTKLTVTDQLTYGVLHGDPTAGCFRIDVDTGRTGLVQWGPAATGPLVYDLAAAVLDAGGPATATELLDGYAAAGPVARDEIEATLPVLLRFRWAVLADRCARRLAASARAEEAADLDGERAALAAARDALAAV
jgi:homoserine kinase type II